MMLKADPGQIAVSIRTSIERLMDFREKLRPLISFGLESRSYLGIELPVSSLRCLPCRG